MGWLNHGLDGEAAPSSKRSTKANTTARLLCKSNACAEIIIDVGAAGENETNKKAVYQSIALRHQSRESNYAATLLFSK